MLRDSEVQELLDRARIADTIYAFCDYCNSGDVEGVVGLFAVDGMMDVGGGAIHSGRGELADMFSDRFSLYKSRTFHCSGVRLVRYDGRTASTTTYLYGVHDAADPDRQMHLWGHYEDELVNEDGVWRFQHRVLCVTGLNFMDLHEVPRRFERREYGLRREIPPCHGRDASAAGGRQEPASVGALSVLPPAPRSGARPRT